MGNKPARIGTAALVATVALALGGTAGAAGRPPTTCTMAVPSLHATVSVRIANAADFCEFVAQGLASEVFRSPVVTTMSVVWRYSNARESCLLRFGKTASRIAVWNAPKACGWFARGGTGWHSVTSNV
jgi:hypothetical protein